MPPTWAAWAAAWVAWTSSPRFQAKSERTEPPAGNSRGFLFARSGDNLDVFRGGGAMARTGDAPGCKICSAMRYGLL